MQSRPPFDRELLIPMVVGTVALLGIVWILLTSDLGEAIIPPTPVAATIPSNVSPLETRTQPSPRSVTPTLEETPPISTETNLASDPGSPAETLPSTSTLVTETPPAPSVTLTPDQVQLLPAGKHDDTHPKITYDRFWSFERNSGTKFAYKGTLHMSSGMGNEASFRFTGQRFSLGYQRGRSFGIVTVLIDDQPYSFHEQALGNIWHSPRLTPGPHFVRLIHESGESINLDYIEIVP